MVKFLEFLDRHTARHLFRSTSVFFTRLNRNYVRTLPPLVTIAMYGSTFTQWGRSGIYTNVTYELSRVLYNDSQCE